ncbi:MAG: radical SAM protein [Alphaproteobacteria bacterium]
MNELTPLDRSKFRHPDITADGSPRARVALERLETLWFNTGTLCNLACANCYIESSPTNDRLAYLSHAEMVPYLDEIEALALGTREIAFTGGEPFMNPEAIAMIETALTRGFEVLVLTNAMKPMRHKNDDMLRLRDRHGSRLRLRVSLDHHTSERHEEERGSGSWRPVIEGLTWLADNGFSVDVAGRRTFSEGEGEARQGYQDLFDEYAIPIDALNPARLILFPEMAADTDVPEITEACWDILGVRPVDQMCASSRMVVKRKGAAKPSVLSCTLIAYDEAFELGTTLRDATRPVSLNHPFCAQFCVLGGANCSS